MPDIDDRFKGRKLDEIKIEEIDLSLHALNLVRRVGITVVQDCIDYFKRDTLILVSVPSGLFDVMDNEVKDKIRSVGLWPLDLEIDMYKISTSELELSQYAIEILNQSGKTSVGACIDYMRHGPAVNDIVVAGLADIMADEVRGRIKALGFMPFDLE